MEFIGELSVQDYDWFLENDIVKFLPNTTGFEIGKYGIEIRSSDYIKDTYVIEVLFDLNVTNGISKERLFYADVIGSQKFTMNKDEIPNVLSCFDVINRTWDKFYLILNHKAQNSLIRTLPRPLPVFDELKDYIETSIHTWDTEQKNIGLN